MTKRLLPFLLTLLASGAVAAQAPLPELEKAPEIHTGSLPNGISYYIAACLSDCGHADMALVQRDFRDLTASRSILVSSPHFGSRRPCDFLADHGIGYGPEGIISNRAGSTSFNFRRVPVHDKAAADSTFLLLFDIASTCPTDQAVIVCGDIDPASVVDRLSLLSMTLGSRAVSGPADTYVWKPRETASCYFTTNAASDLSQLRISYTSDRVPRDRMNTLQLQVTKQYATYLGYIVQKRVLRTFRAEGIPLADFEYRYRDSASGPGNEMYTFTISTSSAHYHRAVELVAGIFANLNSCGVSREELQDVQDRVVSDAMRDGGNRRLTNAGYVRKCSDSYLYNATLASESLINGFFSRGRTLSEMDLSFFNGFVTALLDPQKNLVLGFDTPKARINEDLRSAFDSAWRKADAEEASGILGAFNSYGDTLCFREPDAKNRIHLLSESPEPVSGGKLWKFSNGMRVIFKKTDTKGEFRYAMLLRGGAGLVPGLQAGESPFVADMLSLCSLSGLGGEEFRGMLASNGIKMSTDVSLSDLRVQGNAPASKRELVLKALTSIAGDRSFATEDYEYYRLCESLRLERRALTSARLREEVDRLLSPGYRYTPVRDAAALHDDLPRRSFEYFNSQFLKCADGILAFVGDLDEEAFKKELCLYLGVFSTEKRFASRPRVESKTIAGTSSCILSVDEASFAEGQPRLLYALSFPYPYNLSSDGALRIACELLSGALARALAPLGASFSIERKVDLYPQERVTLYISCVSCRERGLPQGIAAADMLDVMAAVRAAVQNLVAAPVPAALLADYKTMTAEQMAYELSSDEACMSSVLTRFSEGKDLVSGYRSSIDAVEASAVQAAFNAMASGGKVEYVIH